MSKLKVCLIGNDYKQQFPLLDYGGIESCVENLAIGLHDHFQDEVECFSLVPKILDSQGKKYPFPVIGLNYVESFKSGVQPIHFIEEIKGIIRNSPNKPDIIWAQSNWSAALADLGIPVICTMHDSAGWSSGKFPYHPNVFYRFVSKFLVDCTFATADTDPEVAQIKAQSFWCHSGLIDSEYDFEPNKDGYILWCAGLHHWWSNKGLDDFIQLAKMRPDQKFKAYGTGHDGIAHELSLISQQLKNFEFCGKLNKGPEHINVFKKAKLFAMFSKIPEAFARTSLEAVSKGTPVLGTLYGSVPEQVGYPNVGVCSNNLEELAAAIDQPFDNQKCFEFSKKYHIKNEARFMIDKSKEIISNAKG